MQSCSVWREVLLLFCLSLSLPVSADMGVVRLANHIPDLLDAPVFDETGTNRLQGLYAAQLYAGRAEDSLRPVSAAALFVPNAAPGYFQETHAWVEFGQPGDVLFCQVRVFAYDRGPTYEMALAVGAAHGESEVFKATLGTQLEPGVLSGLKSFKISPPAHGAVLFQNLVPGRVNAPVLDIDGSPLAGPEHVAQLYAKLATNGYHELTAVGEPVPFGIGEGAGFWQGGTVILTNIGVGQLAQVQIVVWEIAKGRTYEEAVRAGSKRGQSAVLTVRTEAESTPALLPLTSMQLGGLAFGTIAFSNRIPGRLDVPVKAWELMGPDHLVEAPYMAQLWVQGQPVSDPVPFGTGPDAGYWQPPGNGIITLTNVQAGDVVFGVELRIWDGSLASSYEEALLVGHYGSVRGFGVRSGGAGMPPSDPAILEFYGAPNIVVFMRDQPHVVQVEFKNFVEGIIDEPVTAADGTRLSGSHYVAQLYVESFPDFIPLGPLAPFGTGALAGYWQPGQNSTRVIAIQAGCCATVQVRVWDITKGATYEQAGESRAMSRTTWFFGGTGRLEHLNGIGPISLQKRSSPSVILKQNPYYPILLDMDFSTPLTGPDYTAQLFVSTSTNYSAVGPAAPIDEGPHAGHWQVDSNLVIELPAFQPGEGGQALLRWWETAKGSTFAEAQANGSLLGETYGPVYFRANQLEEPPAILDFSYASGVLRGKLKAVSAPPGLSLVGNPFARGPFQGIWSILNTAPEGTMLYIFDPTTQSYRTSSFDFGSWNSNAMIPFGAGVFVSNPSSAPLTLTFQGVEDTPPRSTARLLKPQFVCLSGTRTNVTTVEDVLGFPVIQGDRVYRYAEGLWSVSQYDAGAWSPFTPALQPGEAVFIRLMPEP